MLALAISQHMLSRVTLDCLYFGHYVQLAKVQMKGAAVLVTSSSMLPLARYSVDLSTRWVASSAMLFPDHGAVGGSFSRPTFFTSCSTRHGDW